MFTVLVVLEAGAQYGGVLLKLSVGGVNAGVITACGRFTTLASFTV
jgi:hypothetical protein